MRELTYRLLWHSPNKFFTANCMEGLHNQWRRWQTTTFKSFTWLLSLKVDPHGWRNNILSSTNTCQQVYRRDEAWWPQDHTAAARATGWYKSPFIARYIQHSSHNDALHLTSWLCRLSCNTVNLTLSMDMDSITKLSSLDCPAADTSQPLLYNVWSRGLCHTIFVSTWTSIRSYELHRFNWSDQ